MTAGGAKLCGPYDEQDVCGRDKANYFALAIKARRSVNIKIIIGRNLSRLFLSLDSATI